ncbi:MAG: MAPEG family protein, partial [Paracoccaceae bacterium]
MTDMFLPITTLLASTLLAWLLVLSFWVIRLRQSGGASLGDGDDETLRRRIRAQANLTEYAPLFVILIAVLELQNGNAVILALLSVVFCLGRLAHGYSLAFTDGNAIGRVGGMGLTLAASGLAVVYG